MLNVMDSAAAAGPQYATVTCRLPRSPLRDGVVGNHRGIKTSFEALQKLTAACGAVARELGQKRTVKEKGKMTPSRILLINRLHIHAGRR